MSTSASGAAGGAGDGGDKPPGFTRFMRRASKVLGRGSSKRASTASASESRTPPTPSFQSAMAGDTSIPGPSTATQPAEMPSEASRDVPATIQQSVRETKPSPRLTNPRLATTAAQSNAILEEKVRNMFAKYDLSLEYGEWTPPMRGDAERVEKKVRMRVHRICHRCQTTFGTEKVCNKCQHTRCKKCARFPAKRPKEELAVAMIAVDPSYFKGGTGVEKLTFTSRMTGKELARRGPVQRVRRFCHKCDTLFAGKATVCDNCNHVRCPSCRREPPKLKKYPEGYPGDQEEAFPLAKRNLKNIRTHVKWKCHTCSVYFKDHEKKCGNCGHDRCDDCPRHPPKKIKRQFDEAAIRSVEERMKAMEMAPQASAA